MESFESCSSLLMWNNFNFISSRHDGNIRATIVLLFTAGLHDMGCPSLAATSSRDFQIKAPSKKMLRFNTQALK